MIASAVYLRIMSNQLFCAQNALRKHYVILALHDLSLAATIADNVLLLDNGKLILSGDVEEVMQPKHLTKVFGIELERVARAGGKDALLVK